MAKQLMIYERAVAVSANLHRDVSVEAGRSYAFARELNSVPVIGAEFAAAAREYAIVFAGDEEVVFPSVILGARTNHNAFIADDGSWTGTYVPAFLRRYPFVFATGAGGDTFTLCIDREFEGFNTEGRGERLFDDEGNRTPYLDEMVKFATDYQGHFNKTQAFCQKLVELDLLESAQARFTLPGGGQAQLAGFKTVRREKLKALAPDVLAEMVRIDELELCYLHLQSLSNFAPMMSRLTRDAGSA